MNWDKLKKADLVEVLNNLTMIMPDGELHDSLAQADVNTVEEVEYEVKLKAHFKITAGTPDIEDIQDFLDSAIYNRLCDIAPYCFFWEGSHWDDMVEILSIKEV